MLGELKKKYPQYKLNSFYNIWILKPAGMSKGRGIVCYRNLVEIINHVRTKETQWIA